MTKRRRKGSRAIAAGRRLRLRAGDRLVLAGVAGPALKPIGDMQTEIAALGEYEVQLVVVDLDADELGDRWN